MSNNAHELSNRLLNALDNNYNVVDMHTVNEIISILEGINITKELLETTRLGKHVNELRRKTTDPTLARRAKVLVKRWRDLVIPTVASPGHTGSNRSSAERTTVRRLGGTPLTSPALSRQVVSPAVPSPRPPSRPAWGGYESDSQDVILVDDEPPPPPPILTNTHKPLTPTVKRPPSPEPLHDEKKAKRDRRLKKKRGYSRAGSGAEAAVAGGGGITTPAPGTPGALAPGAGNWARHNGAHERRRNGTTPNLDPYSALVHRLPPAGAKKVKTTQELLEQIQSRGNKAPASPEEPDVMLIEPNDCIKAESPLRNGGSSPRPLPVKCPSGPPSRAPSPALEPLEDAREYYECTCGEEEEDPACPAAAAVHIVQPRHVHALHHALVAGVNGTRAPALAPRFAVRSAPDPLRHGLFASVVPLYKYSDYADDYCVKNMSQVPLCQHLPWTEFAPPPPDLPPPPSPPPIRPYPPIDDPDDEQKDVKIEVKLEETSSDGKPEADIKAEIEFKMEVDVEAKAIEPKDVIKSEAEEPPEAHERLKACPAEEPEERPLARAPPDAFVGHTADHRTVERTREDEGGGGGAALLRACGRARGAVPYCYEQLLAAPELSREALRSDRAVGAALGAPGPAGAPGAERDPLGRPPRPARFAEWHESAELGALVALPYVVID